MNDRNWDLKREAQLKGRGKYLPFTHQGVGNNQTVEQEVLKNSDVTT